MIIYSDRSLECFGCSIFHFMSEAVLLPVVSRSRDYVAAWNESKSGTFSLDARNHTLFLTTSQSLHSKISNPSERRKCDDIFAFLLPGFAFRAEEISSFFFSEKVSYENTNTSCHYFSCRCFIEFYKNDIHSKFSSLEKES